MPGTEGIAGGVEPELEAEFVTAGGEPIVRCGRLGSPGKPADASVAGA